MGGGAPAVANDGKFCANRQSISRSSVDHEQVQTVRIDYNINEKNTTWFRFQADTGVQVAFTDPINSVFDSFSPQPLYSLAAGYTHVFSQNLSELFQPGIFVVRKHIRASRFSEDSFRVSHRAGRTRGRIIHKGREGWTIPGSKEDAPPGSLSTIISLGAMGRTNSVLERIRGFFA